MYWWLFLVLSRVEGVVLSLSNWSNPLMLPALSLSNGPAVSFVEPLPHLCRSSSPPSLPYLLCLLSLPESKMVHILPATVQLSFLLSVRVLILFWLLWQPSALFLWLMLQLSVSLSPSFLLLPLISFLSAEQGHFSVR